MLRTATVNATTMEMSATGADEFNQALAESKARLADQQSVTLEKTRTAANVVLARSTVENNRMMKQVASSLQDNSRQVEQLKQTMDKAGAQMRDVLGTMRIERKQSKETQDKINRGYRRASDVYNSSRTATTNINPTGTRMKAEHAMRLREKYPHLKGQPASNAAAVAAAGSGGYDMTDLMMTGAAGGAAMKWGGKLLKFGGRLAGWPLLAGFAAYDAYNSASGLNENATGWDKTKAGFLGALNGTLFGMLDSYYGGEGQFVKNFVQENTDPKNILNNVYADPTTGPIGDALGNIYNGAAEVTKESNKQIEENTEETLKRMKENEARVQEASKGWFDRVLDAFGIGGGAGTGSGVNTHPGISQTEYDRRRRQGTWTPPGADNLPATGAGAATDLVIPGPDGKPQTVGTVPGIQQGFSIDKDGKVTFGTGGQLTRGPRTSLQDAIFAGESGKDGYNAYNRGTAGDADKKEDLENMTLAEIQRRQALPQGHPERIFAAGAYQIIPKTLQEAMSATGISPDAKFDKTTQDRLGRYLIDKRAGAYIRGESNDLDSAHRGLAKEWRGLKGPEGLGYSDGDRAGNNASVDGGRTRSSLEQARADYAAGIAAGLSPREAFDRATVGLRSESGATPNGEGTGWFAPTDGRVGSQYGQRGHGQHFGVDIRPPAPGQMPPVWAAKDGKVVSVDPNSGTLVIDHGNGVKSTYRHMERIDVKPGDEVRGGQGVGQVGSRGRSTGPHLHFEVEKDGKKINPATVIPEMGQRYERTGKMMKGGQEYIRIPKMKPTGEMPPPATLGGERSQSGMRDSNIPTMESTPPVPPTPTEPTLPEKIPDVPDVGPVNVGSGGGVPAYDPMGNYTGISNTTDDIGLQKATQGDE